MREGEGRGAGGEGRGRTPAGGADPCAGEGRGGRMAAETAGRAQMLLPEAGRPPLLPPSPLQPPSIPPPSPPMQPSSSRCWTWSRPISCARPESVPITPLSAPNGRPRGCATVPSNGCGCTAPGRVWRAVRCGGSTVWGGTQEGRFCVPWESASRAFGGDLVHLARQAFSGCH